MMYDAFQIYIFVETGIAKNVSDSKFPFLYQIMLLIKLEFAVQKLCNVFQNFNFQKRSFALSNHPQSF